MLAGDVSIRKEVLVSITPSLLGRPVGAKGEETRERILAAAMRCVAEVGYSRATIREIARLADMTSGSLYHYFPNKSELIKATFINVAETAVPRLSAAADRAEGVVDKLVAIFDEGGQLQRDYPYASAFERAIQVENTDYLQLAQNCDSIFTVLRSIVVSVVEEAYEEGALGEGVDVESVANVVYTILRGLHEHAATAPAEEYQSTVGALKRLIEGTLFTRQA